MLLSFTAPSTTDDVAVTTGFESVTVFSAAYPGPPLVAPSITIPVGVPSALPVNWLWFKIWCIVLSATTVEDSSIMSGAGAWFG